MDLDELKEFTGATEEEAVQKAREHFGVSAEQLQVRLLPDHLKISGIGSRVIILAAPREAESEIRPQSSSKLESVAVDLGPVGRFANDMLGHLRLPGPTHIEELVEDGGVHLTLRGEVLEDRARRDSRLADALSHLIQRAAERLEDGPRRVRVTIGNVENRPDEEHAPLIKLAEETAREVKRTGKAVLLDSMNSKERWVVHNTVSEIEGVRSESIGEGREKRVNIEPE